VRFWFSYIFFLSTKKAEKSKTTLKKLASLLLQIL
jgi:hypothetical protein